MNRNDYWCEALAESFSEHGVTATDEQLKSIARDMELAREHESQAFYVPENPMVGENARLAKALKDEQDKIGCLECNGHGSVTTDFGVRSSTSRCDWCNGEGKVSSRKGPRHVWHSPFSTAK